MRRYLSWIEGLTTNQYVGGSNPSRRTTLQHFLCPDSGAFFMPKNREDAPALPTSRALFANLGCSGPSPLFEGVSCRARRRPGRYPGGVMFRVGPLFLGGGRGLSPFHNPALRSFLDITRPIIPMTTKRTGQTAGTVCASIGGSFLENAARSVEAPRPRSHASPAGMRAAF